MAKLENLTDEERLQIVKEELTRFKKIVKGHEKILEAIGKL